VIKSFKAFIMRGSVVDLAVGVVIGVAFGAVVSSLVKDVIMPPIGLLLGKVVIFFLVVQPIARLMARQKAAEAPAPATKECPYCLSAIPVKATRCPHCTSQLKSG
jgi:large conductance mechanosensitive channel